MSALHHAAGILAQAGDATGLDADAAKATAAASVDAIAVTLRVDAHGCVLEVRDDGVYVDIAPAADACLAHRFRPKGDPAGCWRRWQAAPPSVDGQSKG